MGYDISNLNIPERRCIKFGMGDVPVRYDNILVRIGAGSTPESVRLQDSGSIDYRKDAAKYHDIPPVTDYQIQSLNPALQV